MKDGNLWNWRAWLGVGLLVIGGGCSRQAISTAPRDAAATTVEEADAAAAATTEQETADVNDSDAGTDVANASFQAISSESPLPPAIRGDGPAADVIRMANSGAAPDEMLTFISKSSTLFNLSADEIIYLNDIGVPTEVVTAMLRRDDTLKQAAMKAAPAAAVAEATTFVPLPQPALPPPNLTVSPPEAPSPPETDEASAPQPVESVDSSFYNTLAPYGAWVNINGCGPCWQPTAAVVNAGWQPYLNGGHWVYTDCGWYWASDYSWGWVAFHYGRWIRHGQLGWCWVPDPVWAPAWVCWRNMGLYAGWAPLPPGAGFAPTTGAITFLGRSVAAGFAFGLGANAFVFVDLAHFRDHDLTGSVVPHTQTARLFQHTVATTGLASRPNGLNNRGLPVSAVVASSHIPIREVALRDVGAPVAGGVRAEALSLGGRTLAVYRPQVSQGAAHSVTLSKQAQLQVAELEPASSHETQIRPVPAAAQFGRTAPEAVTGTEAISGVVTAPNQSAPTRPRAVRPPSPEVTEQPQDMPPQALSTRWAAHQALPHATLVRPTWNAQAVNPPLARFQNQLPWSSSEPSTPPTAIESRVDATPLVPRANQPPARGEEPRPSAPAFERRQSEQPPAAAPRSTPPPAASTPAMSKGGH